MRCGQTRRDVAGEKSYSKRVEINAQDVGKISVLRIDVLVRIVNDTPYAHSSSRAVQSVSAEKIIAGDFEGGRRNAVSEPCFC